MGGVFRKWSPSLFQLILFGLAGGLAWLGDEFALPVATELGLACLGLFMAAAGVEMTIKRLGVFRIGGWTQAKVVDTYRGLAEILWGVLFICLGLVVTAVVVINRLGLGMGGTFWSELLSSTTGLGAILAGAGLMMLLNGLIRALAGSGSVDPRRLGGMPFLLDRLAGAGTLLFGGAISSIGLLLLISPGVAAAAIDAIKGLIMGP